MGELKELLSASEVHGGLFHDSIRVESAEAIHLHWRDMRILLSPSQFFVLGQCVREALDNWNGQLSEDKDLCLSLKTIPGTTLFGSLMSIEEQANGFFHFHYQDMRIEMTPERFLRTAELFRRASEKYQGALIPLDDINPYDPGHFATEKEWRTYDESHPDRLDDYAYHQEGIALIVEGLQAGKTLLPLAVQKAEKFYQRIDGFKRYMAAKSLGWFEIPCYIFDPDISPGVQDGQSWFLGEG